jgi:hypothetical protein
MVKCEPIICVTATTEDGHVYLTDPIDTSGHPHTSEYLKEFAMSSVKKVESEFGCQVGSIVTDNAANVAKMRRNLESRSDIDVVSYGCSAHLLNLLAQDLEIDNVKEHIVHVVKYFRNNHFALAEYRASGSQSCSSTRHSLEHDVRLPPLLQVYIANWSVLLKICEANRNVIDSTVQQKVSNMVLKRSAEDLLARLETIAVALDSAQSDRCNIADVVDIWKKLESKLPCDDKTVKQKFKSRYGQAVTPSHLLANLLHPRYQGQSLNDSEKKVHFNMPMNAIHILYQQS